MNRKLKRINNKYHGDLTGIWGDLTYVRGDLTDIRGDLDECELTDEERKKGIDINDLIEILETEVD